MYLLQASGDDSLTYIFLGLISLLITYFIIREAVSSGTRRLYEQQWLANKLKIEEMKKAGHTNEELRDAVQKVLDRKATLKGF